MSQPIIPPKPEEQPNVPQVIKHVAEMSSEELEKLFKGCDKSKESYLRCKREGLYDYKKDRCGEERERKEREEKEKADRLAVLEQREAVWLQDAKQKEKEYAEYKLLTEERLNKLALLVQQLANK